MKNILIAAVVLSSVSLNVQAADLAVVNGVAVKQSLLDFIVKDAAAQGKAVDDNARAVIIEKLITTELIDQEAQRLGITKQAEFLIKEKLTLQELRVKAFIEDYVQKNPIDDNALQAEYKKLTTNLVNKEYKASHILVKTEDEAKEIIASLSKGVDFAQLAREKSLDGSKDQGGDLGWFPQESMVQPFADAVAKLQKGSYSKVPVQTEFGWHVIKLEDTHDTQPPSFESTKEQLRNDLQRQQIQNLVSDLRAKAKVVNNPAP